LLVLYGAARRFDNMVSLKTVGGFLSVAIFSLGLAACGSDGGSQVAGSKKMTELTAAEKQQLCEEGKDEAASHEDAYNKLSCYLQAAVTGTCDPTAVQTCLTQAATAPSTEECHVDVTAACTATVGELRACADATTSAVESAMSGISCSNYAAKFASLQGAEPAACTTAKQKCAELFQGDGSGDPNP
jgi:hypothetical protein